MRKHHTRARQCSARTIQLDVREAAGVRVHRRLRLLARHRVELQNAVDDAALAGGDAAHQEPLAVGRRPTTGRRATARMEKRKEMHARSEEGRNSDTDVVAAMRKYATASS